MTTDSQNKERLFAEFPHPSYEEWRRLVEQQLKGAPFEKKLVTRTYEDIEVQPMYRQEDVADLPHLGSAPGFPPYVRGATALGYLLKPWAIGQELPYSTVDEFNSALRYDLERGQTAVNLRPDKATLLGQDPDEAQIGDVGRDGVSIATVDDLARALAGIDLVKVPIFIQAHSAALPTTALLIALLRRQGKSTEKLQGSIEMDPLGILARAGTFPRSIAGAYDRMAHLMAWAKAHAPHLQTVTVHGQPYHDSGGSAVQELAFVLATAVEYVRELLARNLTIDEVAPRIRFSFSIGSTYFMEVAKLRAARMIWAKVVEAFGGHEASQSMSMHVRTSAWNKAVYDPYVNMLRTTIEAFAGSVGGCDSMHVGAFDEAIRPPDEFSRRIARNTQLILQQECYLTRVIDPAGGSWYVENLTGAIAQKAWALFQEVEKRGGMSQALPAGFPQEQVAQTAAQRATNLATRKDILVGVNMYLNLAEKPLEDNKPDYEALHKKRSNYVAQYRTSLNNTQSTLVLEKLSNILNAAPAHVMEAAIEAALAGATLGEIARTLRSGDEVKITIEPLPIQRRAEMFETLRAAAEAYQAQTGSPPQVFLANMGPLPQHKARADFAAGFFQIGGFEVIGNEGFSTPEAAAQAALASGAPVVVICSTDQTYPELVAPLTRAIKATRPETMVILAGYPADQVEAHKAAGVDDFIQIRANTYEILSNLQQKLGISS